VRFSAFPSEMAHDYSIIEFFPDRSASNCGYCSGTNCSVSTGAESQSESDSVKFNS